MFIYVWSDGSWLPADEYSAYEYAYKGFDFCSARVSDELTDEQLDAFALKVADGMF